MSNEPLEKFTRPIPGIPHRFSRRAVFARWPEQLVSCPVCDQCITRRTPVIGYYARRAGRQVAAPQWMHAECAYLLHLAKHAAAQRDSGGDAA